MPDYYTIPVMKSVPSRTIWSYVMLQDTKQNFLVFTFENLTNLT